MGLATFKGGIHPYEGKELSENKPIQVLLPKGELVFPMSQHIGAPAKPLVAKGDRVLAGQKIGEPPQQRIGSDSGIAVGTAAFQTEGEFAEIAGFALIMAHDLINLLEQLHGAVNLILNVLAVQTADALRIDLFQRVVKRFQLIVFTA